MFTTIRASYASCYSLLLVLGPSAPGKGKNTSDNENLRNLRYTKSIFHVISA